ncbi:MAG: WD40 repeat domain-containing protein [Planctomycetota bacterium]
MTRYHLQQLAHVVSWEPYGDLGKFQKDAAWAAFSDASHVMTASSKGQLVKWRIDDLKPIFRCQTSGKPQPVLTPGRRFLVASFDVGVGVMDTEDGELAAVIETAWTDLQHLAFNPGGTKLAGISGTTIHLWDVFSGQLLDEIVVPVSTGSELDWVTENEVLLGREYLFDLQRRTVLWQYKLGRTGILTRYSGDLFFYLAADQAGRSRGLFPVRLPDGAARAAADELSAHQLLVLKPGSEVTIRMQTNLPPAEKQKAHQALKTKCEANGFTVVSNSSLVFRATSKLGEPKEVTYRMFGSFRKMTREVTPILYTLELFENQRKIWKTSGSGGPGFHISLKKNETIDNAIERLSQPNATFFTRVEIPRKLARPAPNAVAYGATMLGFGGPRRCDPDSR